MLNDLFYQLINASPKVSQKIFTINQYLYTSCFYLFLKVIYHNFSTGKSAGRVVIGKEAQKAKTTEREAPVYLV